MPVDDELERFKREINLPELAATYGYRFPRGQRHPTSAALVMKNETTDDKVVIRRDRDGHWTYFSVRDASDNGTIIDFVQRRRGTTLGGVRRELRDWVVPTFDITAPPAASKTASRDLEAVAREYERFRWLERSSYLCSRGIRDENLRSERFRGTVRVDARGNVIFGHLHPSDPARIGGFEKKNRGFTGFATGGARTVWASHGLPGDNKFVFVEGAIDALSYHQLHPDAHTRYFSTAGTIGTSQLNFIATTINGFPPGSSLILATDRDAAGEKIARQIADIAGALSVWRHPSPIGKDWNDCLQALERDFIRSVESRRGISRGR
jgi:hypothetical protein